MRIGPSTYHTPLQFRPKTTENTAKSVRGLGNHLACDGNVVNSDGVTHSILLGQVAERGVVMLDVACRQCPRQGRLQMARLLAEHGPQMPMPALRDLLAADCPRRASTSFAEQCHGVHFPQLFELFWKP